MEVQFHTFWTQFRSMIKCTPESLTPGKKYPVSHWIGGSVSSRRFGEEKKFVSLLGIKQWFLRRSGSSTVSTRLCYPESYCRKIGQNWSVPCHSHLPSLPSFLIYSLTKAFSKEHEINFTLLLLLLVFSPWAGLGRDQSSIRRLVWLWYAASWASS